MKIVTCNGCFDGLHPGHLFILGFAKAHGDKLVVGINSDEYILKHKHRQPIPAEERANALMELGCVDSVIVFYEDDPREFIRRIRPAVHCIGVEYEGRAVEESVCRELGVRLVYVPRVGKWSSTLLRTENIK